MIAKFKKFEPTDKGLTLILHTDKNIENMRELVEFMGKDCDIVIAGKQYIPKTDRIMQIFDSLIAALKEEHDSKNNQ